MPSFIKVKAKASILQTPLKGIQFAPGMFSFRVGTKELARRKTEWLEGGFNTPGNVQQQGSDQHQFPSSRNLRLMRTPVASLALLNEGKQPIKGNGKHPTFNCYLQAGFNGSQS